MNTQIQTVQEPKATSQAQRDTLLKNGKQEHEIPALSRDAFKLIDQIFAAQRKKKAGAPTENQVKYLVEQMGYKRSDAILFSFGQCSKLIYENKKARGLLTLKTANA